jgi:hypothetical protein
VLLVQLLHAGHVSVLAGDWIALLGILIIAAGGVLLLLAPSRSVGRLMRRRS